MTSSASGDGPTKLDEREICPVEGNVETWRSTHVTWNVFHDLKTKGLFFDVVLNTKDGYSFPAHRIILCTCGEYFRTLFSGRWKSSNNSEIHIPGVTGVVLNQILNFAYKREINWDTLDGAKELLVVADHLGIDEIATKCIRFINEQTDSGNCIDIWNFARKYNCSVLVDNSLSFIHKNIINVALHRPINGRCAYAELSLDDMKSLLQHNELNVATEYLEFFLVVRWVRGNPSERIRVMDKLLQCIRLGTMGLDFLERVAVRHEYVRGHYPNMHFVHMVIAGIKYSKYLADMGITKRSHKSYCGIYPTDVPDDAERTGMPEIFHQVCEPRFPQSLLLVVGGWSNESPTQSAEIYQPKKNKWIPAEECFPTLLRKPRAYHAILYDDGWIYVIGGFDGETTFNGCDRFNIFNGKWQKMCGMINRRCYVGIALLQGEIYAVGGKNGEQEGDRLKSAEKFNPKLNTWTKLPDMIERRSDAGVCSLHDRVYVAGGFTGFQCVSSVEYYDLGLKQWNRVAPMRVPRSGLSTVAYKDSLVVLGGFDGRDRLRTVEVFYPKKNRWTVLPSMQTKRSNFAACVLDGKLIVMGGFNFPSTCAVVEYFDDITTRVTDEAIAQKLGCDVDDDVDKKHPDDYKLELQTRESLREYNKSAGSDSAGEWKVLESMSVSRSALSCCVIENLPPHILQSICTNKPTKPCCVEWILRFGGL